MRLHLFCLAATLLGSLLPSAKADTVYNFTLTSTDGYAGGSGSFALNVPPPATGTAAYSFSGQLPFTPGYLIDAFAQSYTPPPGAMQVGSNFQTPGVQYIQFTDGTLSGLGGFIYSGSSTTCNIGLNIGLASYGYSENCVSFTGPGRSPVFTNYTDAGTVTVTPAATAATPEPAPWLLLGTGVLALAALRGRKSASHLAAKTSVGITEWP